LKQISIITVNYNNKKGLERTLSSVKNQKFRDFEHIIIDAASTDGSVDVIKSYQSHLSYWVSEPDRGIYHGMNKGIAQAGGKYLLFLNSGDYLIDDKALQIKFEGLEYDILFGYHTTVTSNQEFKTITYHDRKIDLGFFVTSTLPHSSTFIKKSLFDKLGTYDESFKICADWVFFFKAVIYNGATVSRIERPVGVFELGGVSTRSDNKELVKEERERFLKTIMDDYAIDYIRQIYPTLKQHKYLKQELKEIKQSSNQSHQKMSQLKGIGLLQKLNRLFWK
jgi:glycosyltransferase involved in cell wall biosynthesis